MNGWTRLRLEFATHNHHHTLTFESKWWQFWFSAPTFHTKIDWVWTDSSHSHQLDPSNVSSLVWWMVGYGWDWNSLSNTITITPRPLSHRWWHFQYQAPTFHTEVGWFWIASGNSHQLDPSNVSSLVWWMVGQGWDWNVFNNTVTTT